MDGLEVQEFRENLPITLENFIGYTSQINKSKNQKTDGLEVQEFRENLPIPLEDFIKYTSQINESKNQKMDDGLEV